MDILTFYRVEMLQIPSKCHKIPISKNRQFPDTSFIVNSTHPHCKVKLAFLVASAPKKTTGGQPLSTADNEAHVPGISEMPHGFQLYREPTIIVFLNK